MDLFTNLQHIYDIHKHTRNDHTVRAVKLIPKTDLMLNSENEFK